MQSFFFICYSTFSQTTNIRVLFLHISLYIDHYALYMDLWVRALKIHSSESTLLEGILQYGPSLSNSRNMKGCLHQESVLAAPVVNEERHNPTKAVQLHLRLMMSCICSFTSAKGENIWQTVATKIWRKSSPRCLNHLIQTICVILSHSRPQQMSHCNI